MLVTRTNKSHFLIDSLGVINFHAANEKNNPSHVTHT